MMPKFNQFDFEDYVAECIYEALCREAFKCGWDVDHDELSETAREKRDELSGMEACCYLGEFLSTLNEGDV